MAALGQTLGTGDDQRRLEGSSPLSHPSAPAASWRGSLTVEVGDSPAGPGGQKGDALPGD